MSGTGLDRRRLPTAALLAGALLFALGMGLALARVPEWRLGPFPDQRALSRHFQAIAARCGVRLLGGPRFELAESSRRERLRRQVPLTSAVPSAAVTIRVEQEGVTTLAGQPYGERTLKVWFDTSGRPQGIDWGLSGSEGVLAAIRHHTFNGRPETFAGALLAPGESLGRPIQLFLVGFPFYVYAIAGSAPPQHMTAANVGVALQASRNPGDLDSVVSRSNRVDPLAGSLEHGLLQAALITIAGAFVFLAIRRRISLANASWLAALACLAVLPGALRQPSVGEAAAATTLLVVASVWLVVLWSAAESLWRAGDTRFDATLDFLRARRLTYRTGRALLSGVGLGAAAAGISLAVLALATLLPDTHAHALSVDLPVVDGVEGPIASGITLAAAVAFLLACGRRLSQRRWVLFAVALVIGLTLSPIKLQPWPLELAGSALVVGVLVAAAHLGGLTTLLAAALAYRLLPAAIFAAMHLSWLPGSFALAAGALALLLAAGIVGVVRPAAEEEDAAPPPAFMARLERERRLEVEMELLARMQLGLLPSQPPLVPGWEIAARSLLAERAGGDLYDFVRDSAGRWWIAAGDVAGHGYSCAIAQAMVKAALASLLGDGRTPGEILSETDRVLRTAGASRSFTSLALLRLDPATGEALLANAGHPYPLLAALGQPVREVVLPGLPLGQGPPRWYDDQPLALGPGDALVLCSDGLFEAVAAGRGGGAQYGYERPRSLLDSLAGHSAAEILEALLADWRRHRGPGAPGDDTTIVVVRRTPAVAASRG
ncbi:MAG TPA: PP2C family protein-serine/threonine phosphatase [Thermoanaerobaculia bacterium]|nr:PP2C family protein-serine/threonine phosphatase [Thermoanaerobaculia bacterium]